MDKTHFITKDLAESAFLYASGKKLIKTENVGRRIFFAFDNKDECEKLSSKFWQNEATIKAKGYADAFRTIKDLVFNQI